MNFFLKLTNTRIFILATIAVLVFYFLFGNLSMRLELLIQDVFFKLRGPLKPGHEVVIATIDEKSIDKLGRWPWPRNVMAELVESLSQYKVKVLGLDIVFSSLDTSSGTRQLIDLEKRLQDSGVMHEKMDVVLQEAIEDSDNDLRFFNALKKSKKAVLGYFFHFSKEGLEHLSEKEMEGFLKIISKSRYSGIKKEFGVNLKEVRLIKAYAVEASIEKISKATKRAGYFNFVPEIDGSVRKVPLIVKYREMVDIEGEDDYLFPPLSLTVLRKYSKSAILILIDPFGVKKVALIGRESFEIPTNAKGEMRINFYGKRQTFPHYSIVDIIEKAIAPELLENKIVLIGPTATAIEDLRITPFDKIFPGVEVHATIIDNILHGRFLMDPQIPKTLLDIVSVIGIGLVLLFAIPRMGAVPGGALALFLIFVSFSSHFVFFSKYRIVLNVVPPLLEVFINYIALAMYKFIREEKEKRFIQGAFSQYLSPAVIKEIILDPGKLSLGGVRKEMTAFFSDVAGFSSVSESLEPEELVSLLNDYLTDMSQIIMDYNGTVDKYEGDAIIAFFGAPLDDHEHAIKCCHAAIKMQRKLDELREGWKKEGKALLRVRIGINTGPMVVGNMGSRVRMDYTIMGDAVNLAARLEGANKQYGTETMISHFTYEACKHLFEFRELDSLRVVGKKEVITVYELLSLKNELDPEKQRIIDLYNEGFSHYKGREWKQAIDKFKKVIDYDVNDGPSLTYLERCLDFQLKPPDKSWDGVYILTTK